MIEEEFGPNSEPPRKRRLALSTGRPLHSQTQEADQNDEIVLNLGGNTDNSMTENSNPNNKNSNSDNSSAHQCFLNFLQIILPCIFPPPEQQLTKKELSSPSVSNHQDNSREGIRKRWKEKQEQILEEIAKRNAAEKSLEPTKNSSRLKKKAAIMIQKHVRIYLAKKEANRLRDELFEESKIFWVEKYNQRYTEKEKARITDFIIKDIASDFVSQLFIAGKEMAALSNEASIILQKHWRGYQARKSLVHEPSFHPTTRVKRKKIPRIDSHPSSLPSRLSLTSLRRLWAKKWYEPQNSVYLHHVGPSPLDVFNGGRKLKKKYDKYGRLMFSGNNRGLYKSESQMKEEIFGPQSIMFKHQSTPPEGKKHGMRNRKILFPSSLKNQYNMFSIQHDPMAWVAFPIGIETKEEIKKKLETSISPAVKAFLRYSPYSQKFVLNSVTARRAKTKQIKVLKSEDRQLDELIQLGYDKTAEELIRDSSQPVIGSIKYDTQSGYRIMYKGNKEWEKISTGERITLKDNYEAESLALSSHHSLLNEYLIDSGIAEANGMHNLRHKALTAEPVIKFLPGGQISISAAPLTVNSFSLTGPLALISSQSNHTLTSHIKSFSQTLSQIKSGKMETIIKKQKKISSTSKARLNAIQNYRKNLGRKPSGWTNLKILSQLDATDETKEHYLSKIEASMTGSNRLLVQSIKAAQAEKEIHSKNPNISIILENNKKDKQSLKNIESKLFPKKKNSKFFSYTYTWLPQPVVSNSVNELLHKRPYKDFRQETRILHEQEELKERISNLQEYDEESYLENIAPTAVPLFPIQEDVEPNLVIYDENDDGDNFSLIEKERKNIPSDISTTPLPLPSISPSKSQALQPSISYADGNIIFNDNSHSLQSLDYSVSGSNSQILASSLYSPDVKNAPPGIISPSHPSSTILSYSEWDNFVEPPNQSDFFKQDSSSYYSKIPDLQSSTTFLSLMEKKQTNNTQRNLKNTSIIMRNSQNISEILEQEARINKRDLDRRSKLRAKSRAKVLMAPSVYKDDLIQEQLDQEAQKKRQKDLKIMNSTQAYGMTHNPTYRAPSPEIDTLYDASPSAFSTAPLSAFRSHNPAKPSWSFHDFLATTKPGELSNIPRVAQTGFNQSHRDGKPVHLKARFKPFYHSNKGAKIDPLHPYSWH